MRALIFTNLQGITKEWASMLWDEQVGIVGKVNFLDPATPDYLVDQCGAHERAMRSLEFIMAAGYPGCDRGIVPYFPNPTLLHGRGNV